MRTSIRRSTCFRTREVRKYMVYHPGNTMFTLFQTFCRVLDWSPLQINSLLTLFRGRATPRPAFFMVHPANAYPDGCLRRLSHKGGIHPQHRRSASQRHSLRGNDVMIPDDVIIPDADVIPDVDVIPKEVMTPDDDVMPSIHCVKSTPCVKNIGCLASIGGTSFAG